MNPAAEGYYFPAEWSPHQSTWLSWPHNEATWPNGLASVVQSYVKFIKIISQGEHVCINVNDMEMQDHALNLLLAQRVDLSMIRFFIHPTNDAWCRDHGPAFLVNPETKQKIIVGWDYNAWGEKYPPYDLDRIIPDRIGKELGLPVIKPNLIMEGGSVDFNGVGTVLTTTSCLLNPNRNPHKSQVQIAEALITYYGVRQIMWLDQGIVGDDTDGHIDDITRFVSKDTVVTAMEENLEDENHLPLAANLESLRNQQLWDGTPLKIITLPMPMPQYWEGQRLPASYANFYICNAAVIVPTFGDPNDEAALNIFRKIYKDREVVGLDSRQIIGGLGSFHCLSQQEPAV